MPPGSRRPGWGQTPHRHRAPERRGGHPGIDASVLNGVLDACFFGAWSHRRDEDRRICRWSGWTKPGSRFVWIGRFDHQTGALGAPAPSPPARRPARCERGGARGSRLSYGPAPQRGGVRGAVYFTARINPNSTLDSDRPAANAKVPRPPHSFRRSRFGGPIASSTRTPAQAGRAAPPEGRAACFRPSGLPTSRRGSPGRRAHRQLWRTSPRTSSRFVTFAQAMSITTPIVAADDPDVGHAADYFIFERTGRGDVPALVGSRARARSSGHDCIRWGSGGPGPRWRAIGDAGPQPGDALVVEAAQRESAHVERQREIGPRRRRRAGPAGITPTTFFGRPSTISVRPTTGDLRRNAAANTVAEHHGCTP